MNQRGNTFGQLESLMQAVGEFIRRSDSLQSGDPYRSGKFADARLIHFLHADADLRAALQEAEEFVK